MSRDGRVGVAVSAAVVLLSLWGLFPLLRRPRSTGRPVGEIRLRYGLDLQAPPAGAAAELRLEAQTLFPVAKVIEARLAEDGIVGVRLRHPGGLFLDLYAPTPRIAERVRRSIAALRVVPVEDRFALRVEVHPDSVIDDIELALRRVRGAVWVGAREWGPNRRTFGGGLAGFVAFKELELERWSAAKHRGEPYVPLDPRYRLVPCYRGEDVAPPTEIDDFAVLEEPASDADRFGGSTFASVIPTVDDQGSLALACAVRAEHLVRFEDWTRRNVGWQLAIVIDGRVEMAPMLTGALSEHVLISLGDGAALGADGHAALERRQKRLASIFWDGVPGTLPVPLRECPLPSDGR